MTKLKLALKDSPTSSDGDITASFDGVDFDDAIDVQLLANAQAFSLYLYEPVTQEPNQSPTEDMFTPEPQTTTNGYTRKDAITDAGLKHFTDAYPTETINKEDLFYYIYGLLHSPDYRTKYADNLSKELPRIPKVAKVEDFWAFSTAGHKLADLHINYEIQPMYDVDFVGGKLLLDTLEDKDYRVEKMKFAKSSTKTAGKDDKTSIIYNSKITITGIPLEAYDYVVNGKSAIEWVMERYAITTHKDSGIVNDAIEISTLSVEHSTLKAQELKTCLALVAEHQNDFQEKWNEWFNR